MNDIERQTEQQIEELLVDWEAARQAGRELSVTELCREHPELAEQLTHRIQLLQKLSWMDEPFEEAIEPQHDPQTSVDETQLPDSDVTVAEFVEKLTDSGVLTADELARLQTNTPENKQQRARELARELIHKQFITPYQAKVILERGDSPLLLDRYVILDSIGSGGMGVVFKALQRSLERVVAVKVLPKYAVDSPEKVERFQREMRTVAKLSHPNVVQAFDAHESNGVYFFAMEYVAGSDLAKLVAAKGPLEVGQAVDIVTQVAAGLSDAHRNNVIHRDVKPANILLSNEGVAKVLDLGLARVREMAQSTTTNHLTRDGLAMGTVTYMSPEQAFDAKQADERSDIYSLGCTLYYLLHGRPMFDHENSVQTIVAHREMPAPPLSQGRADVPEKLEELFQKMVAKDAMERPASMAEVSTALRLCLESEPPDQVQGSDSRPTPNVSSSKSAVSTTPSSRGRWLMSLFPLITLAVLALTLVGVVLNLARTQPDPKTLATSLIDDEVSLIVETESVTYEADFVDELPDEPFEITGAVLYPIDGFDFKKLSSIKPFKSLLIDSQADERISFRDFPGHERLGDLEELGLTGFELTAEDLDWIARQKSLLSLNLTDCKLPADWSTAIGQATNLQLLTLVETNTNDDDLEKLQSLRELDLLDVSNTRVTGAGLSRLSSLPITELGLTGLELDEGLDLTKFAKLRKLYVDGTNFNDAMARSLSNSPLRLIHAGHTKLGPEGIRSLTSNKSLRELGLRGLEIRSEIDAIVSLPQLRHLLAENTDLNDECLDKLAKVEGLKSILVAGTEVTDSGVERFNLRAPSCAVMQDEMLDVE